jgi:hypothetical protein
MASTFTQEGKSGDSILRVDCDDMCVEKMSDLGSAEFDHVNLLLPEANYVSATLPYSHKS